MERMGGCMCLCDSMAPDNAGCDLMWVRCTINRSHSTPCKKAEFEHLQIFSGYCLDFFSACEWQDLSFIYRKSEKTTYLDNLVSQHSPFFEGQSKNSGWNLTDGIRYLGSVPGSL